MTKEKFLVYRLLNAIIVLMLASNGASAQAENEPISLNQAKLCILQLIEYDQTYSILYTIGAPLPEGAMGQGLELVLEANRKISSYPQLDELESYYRQASGNSEAQHEMKKNIYEGMLVGAPDKRAITESILESVIEPLQSCAE